MELEIKLGDRIAKVNIISQHSNILKVKVDDKEYDIDVMQVEKGIYSILYNGYSHNVELIATENPKKYAVNTLYFSYDAEIIDAETRYKRARNESHSIETENTIFSPMPGKVVEILVKKGDKVTKGQTLIIVAAMKMESEYKAMKDGVVAEIFVNKEQTVDGNQALIKID